MRVQSDRPSANGGWLHPIGTSPTHTYLKPEAPAPTINATAMMRFWHEETNPQSVLWQATKLGVSAASLHDIGIAWAETYQAWAFPMKDEYGNTIGIRLRNERGEKWAVRGSRAGLFYHTAPTGICYVLEGPTDTAAAMTIGLQAVGRPSCQGQETMLVALLKHCQRVVIVADNDSPGWIGAERLQKMLRVPSIIWAPPQKDFREFVRDGGTAPLVQALTASLLWHQPNANVVCY